MRIHACAMTQNELPDLQQNISLLLPYVDSVTVIDGGSIDLTIPTLRAWGKSESKLRLFVHPWQDSFPAQRNNVLSRVGEVAADSDWLLFVDPDEFLDLPTLESMRRVAQVAQGKRERYRRVGFRCRSVTMRGPVRVHESQDDYWKGLLIRWSPALKYGHDGEGAVHETLHGADPIYCTGHHPEFPALWYEHRKQENVIWPRGCRNFFIGGGGKNLGHKNPSWVEFKTIADSLGLRTWHEFQRYLLAGCLDDRLSDWMVRHRHERGYDGASEVREVYKTAFRLYHPEQEPAELRGEVIE